MNARGAAVAAVQNAQTTRAMQSAFFTCPFQVAWHNDEVIHEENAAGCERVFRARVPAAL
jgi:hypothetical protein